jgi:hypothetical protein
MTCRLSSAGISPDSGSGSDSEMLKCLKDKKGRPYYGFKKAQHTHPETGGGRYEINCRTDKAEAVHCAAGSVVAESFAHVFFSFVSRMPARRYYITAGLNSKKKRREEHLPDPDLSMTGPPTIINTGQGDLK